MKFVTRIRELFSRPIYIILILFLWSIFPTSFYYGVFIFSFSYFVIYKRGIKCLLYSSHKEDAILRGFIIVWLYGIILGFLLGNPLQYIFANFAGMMCYSLYFFLVKENADVNIVSKIIFIGGIIVSLYSIIRMVAYLMGIVIPFIDGSIGMASTGQERIYFTSLAIAYPLMGCSLFYLLSKRSYRFFNHPLLCFFLASIALMFFSASKGFMLGSVYILLAVPFFYFYYDLKHGVIKIGFVLLILILLVLFLLLEYFELLDVLYMIFDEEDDSNITRYDQLTYMMDDITIFGKGLGASVPGVERDGNAPYGFELTFINLIHKFGIFSLILFWGWFYMFHKSAKLFVKRKEMRYSIIVLSSLGYLLPSIGNPLLMHPSLVVMNAASFYILRAISYRTSEEVY